MSVFRLVFLISIHTNPVAISLRQQSQFTTLYRPPIVSEVEETDYYKMASDVELNQEEFALMKAILQKAVLVHNEKVHYQEGFRISLANYGVQYKIYLSKKGKKLVWINGFCKEPGNIAPYKNLESEVVSAFDGGSCFFRTKIDLRRKKAVPIGINGFG